MSQGQDPHDMLREDMHTFQKLQGRDSNSLPAMIELGFGALTALTGIIWFVAIFWVPDPIPGQAWLGIGMLGLTLFGLPAAIIYLLRRGGAEVLGAVIREFTRSR